MTVEKYEPYRKNKYSNNIIGELEHYVMCECELWGEKEMLKIMDILDNVHNKMCVIIDDNNTRRGK